MPATSSGAGACPACGGLGTRMTASEELVLGDPSISILEGVVLPWGEPDGYLKKVILPPLSRELNFNSNAAWRDIPEDARRVLLYGTQADPNPSVHASPADAARAG